MSPSPHQKEASLADESGNDLKFEAYRTALEARNLEIRLFWQRSNYFLVLNTAIAVGFFSRDEQDRYAFLLSLIGIAVACLWVRINLGSKFWQSRWEHRLKLVEKELQNDLNLFSADWEIIYDDVRQSLDRDQSNTGWLKRWIYEHYRSAVLRKPSVSKTMTILSASFVLIWIVAAVASSCTALT